MLFRSKKYITDFYKKLFGRSEHCQIHLETEGVAKINLEEAESLLGRFNLEELKNVVFGMEKNKAAGPDGFNADFYQYVWPIVHQDLLRLVNDFVDQKINIDRLNYGVVTLVPKGAESDRIQKYIPICLLNVVFKIITQMLVNRLTPVISKVVKNTQTAFINNRFIMDGVVVLHEVLNDLQTKKNAGILFKINFEKAFDKIK